MVRIWIMVLGVGIDVIEIERIRRAYETKRDRFLHKVFSEEEIAYCMGKKDPVLHLAARFCAKEAFVKALWHPLHFLDYRSIEIRGRHFGKKQIAVGEKIRKKIAIDWDSLVIHLSMAHSQQVAQAIVIIEKKL